MKCILVIAAFAAIAVAQLEDIPGCPRMCISNMLAKAGEFGCAPTDVECLCGTFDFVMGVHDCTLEACGPDALTGLDGVNMCEGYGPPSDGPSPSGTTGAGPTATGTDDDDESDDYLIAYSTHPIVSTITTGTAPIETTLGYSTLYTVVDPDDGMTSGTATRTGTGTATGTASGTGTHATTGASSQPTASGSRTASGSGTSTAGGSATSTSSGDVGAFVTAAPGLVGALGLMAVLAM